MARCAFILNTGRVAIFFISMLAMADSSTACESDVFVHEVWGEEQTVEISGEIWTIRHRDGDKPGGRNEAILAVLLLFMGDARTNRDPLKDCKRPMQSKV